MLEIKKLNLHRDGQKICEDLSAEILKSEAVLIDGKNASGKSSLIECLLGKLKPGSGQVLLDGHDISKLKPGPKRMFFEALGLVMQELSLRVHDTVKKALTHHKTSPEELDHALDFLGFETQAQKFLKDLSFSEKRCLDLARSLLHRPKLIIWDEPFIALDEKMREKFQKSLIDLKNTGSTIIIATVNPEDFNLLRFEKIIKL